MHKIYNANRPSQYTIMGEKTYYVILAKSGRSGGRGRRQWGRGAGEGAAGEKAAGEGAAGGGREAAHAGDKWRRRLQSQTVQPGSYPARIQVVKTQFLRWKPQDGINVANTDILQR